MMTITTAHAPSMQVVSNYLVDKNLLSTSSHVGFTGNIALKMVDCVIGKSAALQQQQQMMLTIASVDSQQRYCQNAFYKYARTSTICLSCCPSL